MKHPLSLFGASVALLMVPACASGPRDPGINDSQQDEFRVVTKAPLTVPPDYALRPPTPGQALPAEVLEERATITAFGTTTGVNASPGERALISAANANAVSPVIRAQVDFEEAGMLRKSSSVADRVLFWRDDEEAQAVAESDSATGGAAVTIAGNSGDRVKLPGT
ncbi:MAG: DUF3035 domain-containing protein [Hyphomonadaceae bacterium]|nr:DUF3035 domain-containing protein [Hyphomonadaceae bacterium]